VASAILVLGFSLSVLFCARLGDILRLPSCDSLLAFVVRSWYWIRQTIRG
jgi:hypothetical protein